MSKICYINLTTKEIFYDEYNVEKIKYHGRSLAGYLVNKHTTPNTDRFDDDNVIVFAIGLFTGTLAPSSGRISVATRKEKPGGVQMMNMTGSLPQKIASIGIEALVITGKSDNYSIIHIDENRIELKEIGATESVSQLIYEIRNDCGNDASIIGTGPAADVMLPISTMFSTYPDGYPEYYCSRNGFGDVWGYKKLKAVVVSGNKYFENSCFDKEGFSYESKKLARIIVNDPICGQALPGHGSITLIRLLKDKKNITVNYTPDKIKSSVVSNKKINKTCSPLCVVGCLNRHCRNDEEAFSAPAESEVNAALLKCFSIDNPILAKKINIRAFELGIDSVEFVFSCSIYFKATNTLADENSILLMLNEIKSNSITGKIIGSKTGGVYNLFKENASLKQLVTKTVINEEKDFNIVIDRLYKEFDNIDHIELMYRQIFLLENLGFCIFTAFALINNKEALETMSSMFYYKTGMRYSPADLINFAGHCIDKEILDERNFAIESIQKNIPEFTKVLYRYFS